MISRLWVGLHRRHRSLYLHTPVFMRHAPPDSRPLHREFSDTPHRSLTRLSLTHSLPNHPLCPSLSPTSRTQVGGLCTNFFGGTAGYTWMVDRLNICETAAKYKYRAQDGVEYNLKDIHFHTPSVRALEGAWAWGSEVRVARDAHMQITALPPHHTASKQCV